MTCFNRKDMTLRCLKQLYAQQTDAAMDVFLCDDGSSDGTFEAVRENFPDVYIFKEMDIHHTPLPGASFCTMKDNGTE